MLPHAGIYLICCIYLRNKSIEYKKITCTNYGWTKCDEQDVL